MSLEHKFFLPLGLRWLNVSKTQFFVNSFLNTSLQNLIMLYSNFYIDKKLAMVN